MFKRRRSGDDFSDEIKAHLELEAEQLKSEGISEQEARRRARFAFGSVPAAQEHFYMKNRIAWFDNFLRDLRFAARQIARNPGFAFVAIFTLALGIGANASIFSLVNAIILRPLPYPHPEQLIGLGQWRNLAGEGYVQTGVSAPNMDDITKQTKVFQQAGYYRWWGSNITESNRPESVASIRASLDLLPMFGIQPLMGRFFNAQEMQPGHDQVVILGYRLWQERYASDPGILGKTIDLDEKRYTIIGVMPAAFRFTWDQEMDVYAPLALTPDERSESARATSRDLQAQGRLQSGVSLQQAQAAMDQLAANLAAQYPDANKGWGIKVESLHAAYHRQMATPLLIMSGAVLFVLLIACSNVANLLMVRATGRKREIAIRLSIGANRRRLIVQLLTESLLLATAGGVLGLSLAYVSNRLLTLQMSHYRRFSVPNASVISIDWRVLAYCAGVTLITGVVFGFVPALTASKTDLNESLKENGTSVTTESGRRRLRDGLVIAEMALALVLLICAGLLVRTFQRLMQVDLGIDPTNVVTAEIDLPKYKYPSPDQQTLFFRELLQRVKGLPGVTSAGLDQAGSTVFFRPQGQPPADSNQQPTASFSVVSPGDFKAMGIGIVNGREFEDNDTAASAPVALISETVARRYWPHDNPLGQQLTILQHVYSGQTAGTPHALTVVGVVKDRRGYDLWEPRADIYVPFEQHPVSWAYLEVRTSVAPMTLVPSLRSAVLALDKEQPLNDVSLLSDSVARTYGTLRFPMTLVWIFAALALVLSAIGIFGVMSYTVSRRTQELAIRMALGADRSTILRLILGDGLRVTLIGVAIGLAGALALSRVMSNYVYGIRSTDPVAFLGAALLLMFAALAACYVPARRAMKVDPMKALRTE